MPASGPLVRSARASAALTLLALGAATACSPDSLRNATGPGDSPGFSIVPVTAGGGGMGKPSVLDFATYDGSREVVHPDVMRAPAALGGNLWSIVTPYPNGQSKFENPSIFGSTAGETWTPPEGVTNPLVSTTRGYLSDPDILWDPSRNEARMYFREVVMSGKRHLADNVYYMTSPDGVRWGNRTLAIMDRGHYVVSPTVVRDAQGAWRLWAIDAGTDGCDAKDTRMILRRSTDGQKWAAGTPVKFSQPGYLPWHVDVQWVEARKQYWALVAAYPRGTACTSSSLFLATSDDGETWTTYPAPVLARGVVPQFATNVYRSSLLYDGDDAVTIWMSGARTTKPGSKKSRPTLQWSAAVARTTATALLARVNGPAPTPAPAAAQRGGAPIVPLAGNDVP